MACPTHTLSGLFSDRATVHTNIATTFWEGLSAPFSLVSGVDSKVASIANRVAEIVYSWPPPEEHNQGASVKRQGNFAPRTLCRSEGLSSQPRAASGKKGKLSSESVCGAGRLQAEAQEHPCTDSARLCHVGISADLDQGQNGSLLEALTFSLRAQARGVCQQREATCQAHC